MQVYDRVTPKADKPLRPTGAVFADVTVSDDPVIKCVLACCNSVALSMHAWCCCGHPGVQQRQCPHCRKLSEEGTGQVFMSDGVLAALMCAPRSVYSWDVLITKADGKLFFDTRTGFSIGTITVCTALYSACTDR